MLLGRNFHSLDAKNRLAIPVKLRAELGETFVVSQSIDKCLTIYPLDEWEKYTAVINAMPRIKARNILRYVNENSFLAEPDGQGRVLIPKDMIEYAKIEKNVVVCGCGAYAEIWSEEVYNETFSSEQTESILAQMIEAGL